MINGTFCLTEKYPECKLTLFVHEETEILHPTIVVCPGGGYHFLSTEREGMLIAQYYYDAGFNACVLEYTIAPAELHYKPVIEAGLAIKYMREHANKLGVDAKRIFTCGFSAGGHLAASAGILWDTEEVLNAMGNAPKGVNRPDGMILSYPVITAGKWAHHGSIANLVGKNDYTEKEGERFSLEKHVTTDTPPMFIWHTANDDCVPVKNTTLLIDAYIENGISFEAHIFPKGPHGLALANEATCENNPEMNDSHIAHWIDLSVEWIKTF